MPVLLVPLNHFLQRFVIPGFASDVEVFDPRRQIRALKVVRARHGPTPADTAARDAEAGEEYLRGLAYYSQELARLRQGIWEKEYL